MAKLKFIVTGTGRCGTVYFAKLLTSLGIVCGHETIFSHEGLEVAKNKLASVAPLQTSAISELASGLEEPMFPDGVIGIQADSSYMAAPFLNDPILDGVKVIHLVRNPLEVMNSFIYGLHYFRNNCLENEHQEYHKFIYKHVPRVLEFKRPIDRAAAYYIEWNALIERKLSGKLYCRHNINRNLNKVFDFLGVGKPTNYYNNDQCNHIFGLSSNITNFRQIPSLKLQEEIMTLHQRYFYIKI